MCVCVCERERERGRESERVRLEKLKPITSPLYRTQTATMNSAFAKTT